MWIPCQGGYLRTEDIAAFSVVEETMQVTITSEGSEAESIFMLWALLRISCTEKRGSYFFVGKYLTHKEAENEAALAVLIDQRVITFSEWLLIREKMELPDVGFPDMPICGGEGEVKELFREFMDTLGK